MLKLSLHDGRLCCYSSVSAVCYIQQVKFPTFIVKHRCKLQAKAWVRDDELSVIECKEMFLSAYAEI